MSYSTMLEKVRQVRLDENALTALSDAGRGGRERPWRAYKMANELLSQAYSGFNDSKASRLSLCGKSLTFIVDDSGNKKLINAESCRVRLCPLCAWRRSLKNFWNTMHILNFWQQEGNEYSFIFLTLTVRNVEGVELSSTLDALFGAFQRFSQRDAVRKVFLGMVRNVEITHNINPKSESYDTFHPHIHCIVAVKPSYFKSHDYLSQKRITALWREALRADYDPIVDVRRVKGSDAHAVAECSKYAAKAADYIIPDDWDLTVATVKILDRALDRRRLIAYTGVFRKAMNALKLEDAEDGDLNNVDSLDDVALGEHTRVETYYWYSGYRQYYKV